MSRFSALSYCTRLRHPAERNRFCSLELSLLGNQTYELLLMNRTLLIFLNHKPNSLIHQENKIKTYNYLGVCRTFPLTLIVSPCSCKGIVKIIRVREEISSYFLARVTSETDATERWRSSVPSGKKLTFHKTLTCDNFTQILSERIISD